MSTRYGGVQGEALFLAAVGAVSLTVLALADPETSRFLPPCPWRAVTGWLCPGCGSARAIHALLHGQVDAALRANPLVFAALALAALDLRQRMQGAADPLTYRVRPVYLRALATAVVLFGILRNVSI